MRRDLSLRNKETVLVASSLQAMGIAIVRGIVSHSYQSVATSGDFFDCPGSGTPSRICFGLCLILRRHWFGW
jgi:hypothetical protein